MRYESTRGGLKGISAAEAIKTGIAPDGGLFVPMDKVTVDIDFIKGLTGNTYQERAMKILSLFLTDYKPEELLDCINSAYDEQFSNKDVAPVVRVHEKLHMLELWHGPTCAFKDMALQILPHFLVKAIQKTGEQDEIVILVATSGDTGKAALEGFADVDGTRIIVYYPNGGVSDIQKLQMVTQKGKNTNVIAVNGNFDDTQNGVKKIFTDASIRKALQQKGLKFSSANSINWGRLVPQIVYYFSAYAELIKEGSIQPGEKINFVVPTGNFGNILAAWYAKDMGLPVNRLICASNSNNVLTDFIIGGVYDKKRDFYKTISPSMDILISSNLERLLYELSGKNADMVHNWMKELAKKGSYHVDNKTRALIQEVFWGGYSDDKETLASIHSVYEDCGYVMDPHTAVAMDVYDKYVIKTGDLSQTVIVSTASPFKFNASVAKALLDGKAGGKTEFELLPMLSEYTGWNIPEALKGLERKDIVHRTVCEKDGMTEALVKLLKLDAIE
ncbi:MAG: threonine synthase [Clostridiaceae bacterium]|jgi:threonine synthase|nr:threonine synthase [Clostridiaceae bacterium]